MKALLAAALAVVLLAAPVLATSTLGFRLIQWPVGNAVLTSLADGPVYLTVVGEATVAATNASLPILQPGEWVRVSGATGSRLCLSIDQPASGDAVGLCTTVTR